MSEMRTDLAVLWRTCQQNDAFEPSNVVWTLKDGQVFTTPVMSAGGHRVSTLMDMLQKNVWPVATLPRQAQTIVRDLPLRELVFITRDESWVMLWWATPDGEELAWRAPVYESGDSAMYGPTEPMDPAMVPGHTHLREGLRG